jgi:SpoVK/Ycf46/Vps4 family AAA+-type ATPase
MGSRMPHLIGNGWLSLLIGVVLMLLLMSKWKEVILGVIGIGGWVLPPSLILFSILMYLGYEPQAARQWRNRLLLSVVLISMMVASAQGIFTGHGQMGGLVGMFIPSYFHQFLGRAGYCLSFLISLILIHIAIIRPILRQWGIPLPKVSQVVEEMMHHAGVLGDTEADPARQLVEKPGFIKTSSPPSQPPPELTREHPEPGTFGTHKASITVDDPAGKAGDEKECETLIRELVGSIPDLQTGGAKAIVIRKAARMAGEPDCRISTRGDVREVVEQATQEYRIMMEAAAENSKAPADDMGPVRDLQRIPTKDFDWVAGMDGLKDRLKNIIEEQCDPRVRKELEKIDDGETFGSGILLYGPPGTGKTFFAEAAAGDAWRRYGVKFVSVPLAAIRGSHHSKFISRASEIFQFIEGLGNCIVLWDEIDGLISDPSMPGQQYNKAMVTFFKEKLQGNSKNGKMILHIGTTNCPENLDLAQVRAGRLKPLLVGPPDQEARRTVIDAFLAKRGIMSVDADKLVEWTSNNTVAEINNYFHEVGEIIKNEVRSGKDARKPTLEDFKQKRDVLKQKAAPAWFLGMREKFKKPRWVDRRDFFKEISEKQSWEAE